MGCVRSKPNSNAMREVNAFGMAAPRMPLRTRIESTLTAADGDNSPRPDRKGADDTERDRNRFDNNATVDELYE